MSLLNRVKVERYRCLRELTVDGFTRINLIVGRNNAGKTALLEAIEWLQCDGSPEPLWQGLKRRGSYLVGAPGDEDRVLDLSELVHGLEFGESGAFPDPPALAASELREQQVVRSVGLRWRQSQGLAYVQTEVRRLADQPTWHDAIYLTGRSGLTAAARSKARSSPVFPRRHDVLHVPSGGFGSRELKRSWSMALEAGNKDQVVRALQLLDPEITDVNASSDIEAFGWSALRISLRGQRRPVSASQFGDGNKRLLGLGLALGATAGGTLLVDELDDGLHYSLLRKLWSFLSTAAEALKVQVFATTHGHDLVAAIADLHESELETSDDKRVSPRISVHRLSPGEPTSRLIRASEVRRLLDANLDPRGQG